MNSLGSKCVWWNGPQGRCFRVQRPSRFVLAVTSFLVKLVRPFNFVGLGISGRFRPPVVKQGHVPV